jgi:hypothetical protein
VVKTGKSGISEYLGADAWYCDSWSEQSIAEAVAAALAAPAPDGVAARLRERCTWRRAAEQTLVVYEEAVRSTSSAAAARGRTAALEAQLEEAGAREAALAAEVAHLQELQETRLFRWSAPLRRLYGRLRR